MAVGHASITTDQHHDDDHHDHDQHNDDHDHNDHNDEHDHDHHDDQHNDDQMMMLLMMKDNCAKAIQTEGSGVAF